MELEPDEQPQPQENSAGEEPEAEPVEEKPSTRKRKPRKE